MHMMQIHKDKDNHVLLESTWSDVPMVEEAAIFVVIMIDSTVDWCSLLGLGY